MSAEEDETEAEPSYCAVCGEEITTGNYHTSELCEEYASDDPTDALAGFGS